MSYKCAFGCTCFNPSCDACESSSSTSNPYATQEEKDDRHKAASQGYDYDDPNDKEDFDARGWQL